MDRLYTLKSNQYCGFSKRLKNNLGGMSKSNDFQNVALILYPKFEYMIANFLHTFPVFLLVAGHRLFVHLERCKVLIAFFFNIPESTNNLFFMNVY